MLKQNASSPERLRRSVVTQAWELIRGEADGDGAKTKPGPNLAPAVGHSVVMGKF